MENSQTSSSRYGSALPVPKQQPLAETRGNSVRQNAMAPPPKNLGQKRELPQPSVFPPAKTKAARTGNVQGQSILGITQNGSSLVRPSSAAGTRHVPAKSVDFNSSRSRIGMGTRPISRPQTAKGRPATAMDGLVEEKSENPSDSTISSRTSFSSRVSSASSSVSGSTAVQSARSVSGSSTVPNARSVSNSSTGSTSTLIKGMSNLCLAPRGVRHPITPRKRSQLPSPSKLEIIKQLPPTCLLPPELTQAKRKSPRKSPPKSPSKEVFLTKDSNRRMQTDFDINERMTSMSSLLETFMSTATKGSREIDTVTAAMEIYKSRVNELESLRERLEANNQCLKQDLLDVRSSLNTTMLQADESRREHLDELDHVKRKSRDEVDEMRRKYNIELDEIRRDAQRSREQADERAQEETKQLERRHQAELDDLRRKLSWALEEEKRERKREVQAIQDQAQTIQKTAETGLEKHTRELGDKDDKIAQLSKQIERERDVADDLRKQLSRSGEQNDDLENVTRSLKARVEFLQSDNQSQSQAFADLEQQTQDALKQTEEYRSQLRKEETIRRKLLNQIQDLKGNIRVFCRVRPPLRNEQTSCAKIDYPDADADAKAIEVRGPEGTSSLGKDMTKTHPFDFDRAFGPASQNSEIFAELSELVAAVCGGSFNTCIFSYGQTGSGKTYTMASQDGMIPRAVSQIFDTASNLLDKGWRYSITGSFVEVYNENINDLLGRPEDFDKKKHEIRHDMQTLTTTITDVVETPLDSAEHFGSVLDQAMQNRSIAATKANERSSRSHSVCILRITGENQISGETCSSTLNLVDLAGSERLAHSQVTGAQLKETQNINKSLSCLKDVIAALGDAREGSHVPYRNSKLTYLLQNSLGGNSKTLMFVMISPLQEHLSETLSSLNFATKVNNTRIIKKPKK